jgi:beta-lactamase superfamily II metal-dependent hydrolase
MRSIASKVLLAAGYLLLHAPTESRAQTEGQLRVYVIDVEGGEATLFVSPIGETLLVDTGWPGFEGRDADRIAAVAAAAGVTRIDHLVVTHHHADHVGGTEQLAARLPIARAYDRGPPLDQGERAQAQFRRYADAVGERQVAAPGQVLPIGGIEARVIASDGSVLSAPLSGAGSPNPACAGFIPHGPEITSRAADAEDQRSVSLFVRFGEFRTVIMGDLTWNKEGELMCPANRLGTVDVYLVSHHGSDTSGSAALVHALRPRAAIMNNGPRKGGSIRTFEILAESPGLEDLWQAHYSVVAGQDHNRAPELIANLDEGVPLPGAGAGAAPVHMGSAHWIELSASADGEFSITNSRTGYTKRYVPRS